MKKNLNRVQQKKNFNINDKQVYIKEKLTIIKFKKKSDKFSNFNINNKIFELKIRNEIKIKIFKKITLFAFLTKKGKYQKINLKQINTNSHMF